MPYRSIATAGVVLAIGFALGAVTDAAVDEMFEKEANLNIQVMPGNTMPGQTVPLVYLDKGLFTVRGLFDQWHNRHHPYCSVDLTTEPLMAQMIRMTSVIQNCSPHALTWRSHNGGNYVLLSGSETPERLP